jgi:hypothetical protein
VNLSLEPLSSAALKLEAEGTVIGTCSVDGDLLKLPPKSQE